MNVRPSLLCAVDYSPASAGALHVAAALAEHFVTRLIVLAVREAEPGHADLESPALRAEDERALAAFVAATLGPEQALEAMCEFELAAGAPAVEITRVARERSCDLIVMARPNRIAGRSGDTATVESVLLATTAPVLLTPPVESGFLHVEDVRRIVRRIVVAVDADAEQGRQQDIAIGLAEALGVDLAFEDVPAPDERPGSRAPIGAPAHGGHRSDGRQPGRPARPGAASVGLDPRGVHDAGSGAGTPVTGLQATGSSARSPEAA